MAGYRSCIKKMLCKEHKKAFLSSQDMISILKRECAMFLYSDSEEIKYSANAHK